MPCSPSGGRGIPTSCPRATATSRSPPPASRSKRSSPRDRSTSRRERLARREVGWGVALRVWMRRRALEASPERLAGILALDGRREDDDVEAVRPGLLDASEIGIELEQPDGDDLPAVDAGPDERIRDPAPLHVSVAGDEDGPPGRASPLPESMRHADISSALSRDHRSEQLPGHLLAVGDEHLLEARLLLRGRERLVEPVSGIALRCIRRKILALRQP